MTPPPFSDYLQTCRRRCEEALQSLAEGGESQPQAVQTLLNASRYSLLSGGKRVRPVLVYAAAEAAAESAESAALDSAACAIEMIHAYSLVHDDLPAMDDDDLRRGKPSCHREYGEATAILVGDGLQAKAFELLASAPGLTAQQRIDMVRITAAAAGPLGMVGGQAIDMAATGSNITLAQLRHMHELKTGALIRAALALGGIAGAAGSEQLASLANYGGHIGLAFQVVDDILDVVSDSATLGKTQGKDGATDKATYVKLMGLDGARAEADRLLEQALESLQNFDARADRLRELARYIIARDS